MIRVPKEWDETCSACQGTGNVHKRESFSLWTPEEYAQFRSFEDEKTKLDPKCKGGDDLPANVVICMVRGGASLFKTCKEGVTLARVYGRPVAFEFNGTLAICWADSDPEDVAKRWWKRLY